MLSEETDGGKVLEIATLVRWVHARRHDILTGYVAQIQKGASSARSDDTKGLKGTILDWITPQGEPLIPRLARNMKLDRGFNHERTGFLLCPAGLDWSDPE